MPPQYKFYEPLPVTNYAGLPKELFNTPPVNFRADYNAALQDKQTLEGGQLALEQKQRQAAQEKAQAEAMAAQFGNMDPNAPVDMNKVWEAVQRTAIKNNDIKTATEVERAMQDKASQMILSKQYTDMLGLPENTPLPVANLIERNKYRTDISDRHNDQDKKIQRYYNAIKAEQDAKGTRKTQLPAVFRSQIIGARGAKTSIGNVRALIPEMDTGVLNALKTGQLTGYYKEPGSASYRLFAQLEKLKKEVARMNDSGALSAIDVDTFKEFTAGSPVYNTRESLALAMSDLEAYITAKEQHIIDVNEASGVNVDSLRTGQAQAAVPSYEDARGDPDALAAQLAGQPQPTPTGPPVPVAPPRNPDGSKLTREQYAEYMRSRGGGQ